MTTKIKEQNYIDVTNEWLINATPNSHKVKDRNYFQHNGIKYYVDNKNVVLDYSKKEKEVAKWLENTFGGEIYMLPRINKPDGIKTADYLFRGEKWDLKTIKGNSNQVIYHSIRKNKKQSNNYIFDITNSKLTLKEAKEQIDCLYKRTDITFINQIILKQKNYYIVYKKRM